MNKTTPQKSFYIMGKENKIMETNYNNSNTAPTPEQIEEVCRQRAHYFWNWLTWSLVYYVVINLFLIAINRFTCPHYRWVFRVIGGWESAC